MAKRGDEYKLHHRLYDKIFTNFYSVKSESSAVLIDKL